MTNATWKPHPGSNDYDIGTNWSGNTIPDGNATFGASSKHALTFSSASNAVGRWTFTSQAPQYVFTLAEAQVFDFTGAGIVANGAAPLFKDAGDILLSNSSTLGTAHFQIQDDGELNFYDASKGGSAHIQNSGLVNLFGTSSAGHGHIQNNDDLFFEGSSTAGHAQIENDSRMEFSSSSTAGFATLTLGSETTAFDDESSAGSAKIIDQDGSLQFAQTANASSAHISVGKNASVAFFNQSSGGTATFVNNGQLSFDDTSTADHAVITTNKGGSIAFNGASTAGDARLITKAGGILDFSDTLGPGADHHVFAGSIEGGGTYDLGGDELILTSNRSTKVSGLIADGGVNGGAGASLDKEGSGTLTLSHADNTYTGGTLLEGGTLNIAALGAAGTGNIKFVYDGPFDRHIKIQNAALSHHAFSNAIEDFNPGVTADLAGLAFTPHAHYSVTDLGSGYYELAVKSGNVTDDLTLLNPGTLIFGLENDGHGGTKIVIREAEKHAGHSDSHIVSGGGADYVVQALPEPISPSDASGGPAMLDPHTVDHAFSPASDFLL